MNMNGHVKQSSSISIKQNKIYVQYLLQSFNEFGKTNLHEAKWKQRMYSIET